MENLKRNDTNEVAKQKESQRMAARRKWEIEVGVSFSQNKYISRDWLHRCEVYVTLLNCMLKKWLDGKTVYVIRI